MIEKIKNFLVKNEWFLIFLFVLVFVCVRIPGTDLPLHQDEYKWPTTLANGFVPHPPLSQFIFHTGGEIVGFDIDFRFIPLFFGAINLILLYYIMRFLFGRREAIIASLIWIFSYFSVLASLMVDTDGQILPFFFLLSLIGYYKLSESEGKKRIWWGGLLIFALVCGILVKLSFALAIGAIIADFLWSKRNLVTVKDLLRYGGYALLAIVGLVAFLLLAKLVFPLFDLQGSLTYWKHFIVFDRGWFQTFIQCAKAVLYSSPFLILVPFLIPKWTTFQKVRVLIFFLIFAFIFYIILFDFSIGALDRYLQLLILPLTVFCSIVLAEVTKMENRRTREFLFLGIVVSLVLILLQSLPHYVPSLHPKSEWVSRILSFRWNFVYPFSGGSGPLGFYVSFLFMGLSWIFSFVAVLVAIIKPQFRKLALVFLIPIGIAYNGVFIEEYLVGHWNGYAPKLVEASAEFIKNDSDIKKVIVYNDNGAQEIKETGKYFRRMYADPAFEEGYKSILSDFNGHILYINVPRIDPNNFYGKYLSTCDIIYQKDDKKMSAIMYDCSMVKIKTN